MYIKKKFLLVFAAGLFLISLAAYKTYMSYRSNKSYQLKAVGQVQGIAAKDSYQLIEARAGGPTPPPDDQTVTISHTVEAGDSLASIAAKYHADAQTILDYPYNQISDDLKLTVGQTIIIPNGYLDPAKAPPTPAPVKGNGELSWPVEGGAITQYASWFHPGAIDIGINLLTPVHAAAGGVVLATNHFTTGYGNHVLLDNGGGLTTLYAHLTSIGVEQGQSIQAGDLLGLSGSTGRSTGPHLHFEVRRNGVPVNPMSLLRPI